jgi:plasmid stabilization system protein ParE
MHDLEAIGSYLEELPLEPANRIAARLEQALQSIANQPYLGLPHSHLTRLMGQEVRSRLVHPYRIFYSVGSSVPEIFAILHGSRDQSSILGRRFQ